MGEMDNNSECNVQKRRWDPFNHVGQLQMSRHKWNLFELFILEKCRIE